MQIFFNSLTYVNAKFSTSTFIYGTPLGTLLLCLLNIRLIIRPSFKENKTFSVIIISSFKEIRLFCLIMILSFKENITFCLILILSFKNIILFV